MGRPSYILFRGPTPGLSGTGIAPIHVAFHKGFAHFGWPFRNVLLCSHAAPHMGVSMGARVAPSNFPEHRWRPGMAGQTKGVGAAFHDGARDNQRREYHVVRGGYRAAAITQKQPVGVQLCLLGRNVNCYRVQTRWRLSSRKSLLDCQTFRRCAECKL